MAEKKSMADIWKQMEKNHGSEGMFVGNTSGFQKCDVISTGSYSLDDALGVGGIGRGRITQFAGFESSGKTLLSFTTIAQWQKQDPRNWAMFIDAEFSYQSEWAEMLGVDTSRLYVYKENNGTKIFEHLVGQMGKNGKKLKQGVLDLEIESGGSGLGIIALDSIAAVIPPVEEASTSGGITMAAMARFLPSELRRLTPLLAASNVAFVTVNQLRMKPGVLYGSPTDSSGGTALKYACSTMINLGKLEGADSRIEVNGQRCGHKIRCRIEKQKLAKPYGVGEFTIKYDEGIINKGDELREIGCKYGVISRPNNRTYVYAGQTFNGKDSMAEYLSDESIQKTVWGEVLAAKENAGPISLDGTKENEESEDSED